MTCWSAEEWYRVNSGSELQREKQLMKVYLGIDVGSKEQDGVIDFSESVTSGIDYGYRHAGHGKDSLAPLAHECATWIEANDRAILTYLGSTCAVAPGDISDAFLSSARHIYDDSFFLHTRLQAHAPAIFRPARALGLNISLDANSDADERWKSALPRAP